MNGKDQLKSRLAYSFGAFGHDMFYAMLSTYFIMFVTSHLFDKGTGIVGARVVSTITLIITILRIMELIVDPFIGNTIDNTTSKWGHFRPWIIIGATISSICIVILFTDMGGLSTSNPSRYLILFTMVYILMDVFYSFKDVSFWSMIPALSLDSRDREKTATYARIGSNIGTNIVGIMVMPLVLGFSLANNGGQGDKRGWLVFAMVVALISWLSSLVVALGTRELDSHIRQNNHRGTFKEAIRVLIGNDQLMWLSLSYALYTSGMQVTNSLELYYFTFILGDAKHFTILASINAVVGVAVILLFPGLVKKFNRRSVFFIAIGIMVGALGIFLLAGHSLPVVILAATLFYAPQPLVFLVVLMTLTDLVEYGQLKFNHRDESLILSMRPLLDKFGGAIANGVVGITAIWAGMTARDSVTPITMQQNLIFKWMMFGLPLLLILLGAWCFLKKVTLDEQQHAIIVNELKASWHQQLADDDKQQPDVLTVIDAPVRGRLYIPSQIEDGPADMKTLTDGVIIRPSSGKVVAPLPGVITKVSSNNCEITIRATTGVELLIRIITVTQIRDVDFVMYVNKGQTVAKGELLLEFWDAIIETGMVVMMVTNGTEFAKVITRNKRGPVGLNDNLIEIVK